MAADGDGDGNDILEVAGGERRGDDARAAAGFDDRLNDGRRRQTAMATALYSRCKSNRGGDRDNQSLKNRVGHRSLGLSQGGFTDITSG